jgi:signal transduction histidine kinase
VNISPFSDHLEESLVDAEVEVQRFGSGETVFLEGDPGDCAYLIRTGSVDIVGRGPDGEARLLNRIRKGELFGEMGLLDRTRRSASAVTREATELFVVTHDEMMILLTQEPQMALWMLGQFSHRLRVLTRLVSQMEQAQEVNLKILAGQEEERRRIGRDIHDGVAQSFADSILRLQAAVQLLERDPSQARIALADLEEGLRQSLERIRELIHDLLPRVLRNAGLVGAIDQLLDRIERSDSLAISFEHRGVEDELPATLEATLFCIVQEALNNVRKHAGASRVRIALQRNEKGLVLLVEDDGCGFDPEPLLAKAGTHNGYGLLSMQERAELAGGAMDIDSGHGVGTKLRFRLPVRTRRAYR